MMNNLTKGRKTLVIAAAAVLVAGIGFGAGMMAKSSMAAEKDITVDEAKAIALSNAGVSENKATFTKAQLDNDGHYDIEFYTASTEYDFEINAKTGRVLEKDTEPNDMNKAQAQAQKDAVQQNQQNQQNQQAQEKPASGSSSVIGVDAAKRAALNHAGLSTATFTKAYLDYDDGIRVYEIEFHAGGIEYDYEINALTGAVLDWDKERHDTHDDWDDDHDDHDWDD